MPANQRALLVNEHRVSEAKFADRGRDLLYLLVGMRSSVAGVGNELPDRPSFYLIRRPLVPILARALCARASMGKLEFNRAYAEGP
jgi:hypothetical protein